MRSFLFSMTFLAAMAAAGSLAAQDVKEQIQSGALSFTGGNGFTGAVLLVTGPGDYEREETASRGLPVFRAQNSGRLVDGFYQYSLTAATDEKVEIKKKIDNGRGAAARDYTLKPFTMQGSFVVVKGTIAPVEAGSGESDGDKTE